jgi:hypothetical protein
LRRDALLQDGRTHRQEQTVALGLRQACRVDQQDHVGRAVGALGLQAGQHARVVGVEALDADAGGLGEVGVERLVGLVVTRRVQVEHLFLGLSGRGEEGGGEGACERRDACKGHEDSVGGAWQRHGSEFIQ